MIVTVVLLSYNRPDYLRRALQSVRDQAADIAEILVVDNPSPSSAEISAIVKNAPGVRLLRPKRNLGFSEGMNYGLHHSSGDLVYLTEDDIVLESRCIAELIDFISACNTWAIVGPLQMNKGEKTIRSAGGKILCTPIIRVAHRAWNVLDVGQFSLPEQVDFLPGSTMLVNRNVLRGPIFRSDFFMYGEDLELCLRLKRAHLPVYLVPTSRVDHLPERSTTRQIQTLLRYHKLKNFFALHALHANPMQFLRVVLGTVTNKTGRSNQDADELATCVRALSWLVVKLPILMLERVGWLGAVRPCDTASCPVRRVAR